MFSSRMPIVNLERAYKSEEWVAEESHFASKTKYPVALEGNKEINSNSIGEGSNSTNEGEATKMNGITEGAKRQNLDEISTPFTFNYKSQLIEIEEWRFLCYDFRNLESERGSLKLLSKLRKGIPSQFRGFFWMKLAEVENIKNEHSENLYFQLSEIKNAPCCGDIYRDISRTFPKHTLFRDRNNHGQNSLFSVLRAYSLYNPDVGYCQGMGFIVGVLLMYLSEEDSFYMLISILDKYEFSGLYLPGLPLLNTHLEKLRKIFKKRIPNLYNHFRSENVDETMYASQWFMTIFAYSFNLDSVARIWDLFFLEGINLIFKISIAILKILKNSLFNQSFENILHTLKTAPYTININELINCALNVKLNFKELA